ncbi:TolC family protein [Bacteroidota bacterium]
MKMRMTKPILLLIICGLTGNLGGQEITLEDYIEMGLQNNLALKQKEVNYQKSLQVLRQARSYFYPDISVNMRYSAAQGGRLIEFPVGTMLNPVYQTLNLLLGQDQFPDIENMNFAFYRPTEHETKLSLVQPIIDPKIHYNSKIKRELSYAIKADADAYQRQLVADIKTAYFNYLKTLRLIELLENTKGLLDENVRVNEKLFENDKITIDYVHRSRAELSKLAQQAALAKKNNQVATAYFNFLLNRSFDQPIPADADYDSIPELLTLGNLTDQAVENREELEMLRSYSRVADNYLSMNQMGRIPSLYAAVDYGFQGKQYEFNSRQDYMFASLVLRWDIFHGFQKKAQVGEARIEQEMRTTMLRETEQQIRLQALEAHFDLMASAESIIAAEEELLSSKNAFRVVDRKYKEGQASLIEYIDSRTSMTQAEERLIISKYDYHIKYAELERAACLYPINEQQ